MKAYCPLDCCQETWELHDGCDYCPYKRDVFDQQALDLREEHLKLQKKLDETRIIEMAICEVPYIQLKPNQLYHFVVIEGCEKCKSCI